ncbi:MAG: hypothetical protein QUU85_17275, partial [Candidatus Eisenbacteria bacterium]|nr:hypothetical protein [Candidatus Eisenbacteria bacterium]
GSEMCIRDSVPLELIGLPPREVAVQKREMIYDGVLSAAVMRTMVLTLDLRDGRAWGRVRAER